MSVERRVSANNTDSLIYAHADDCHTQASTSCARQLQAVLQETPLTQVGEVFKDVPDEEMKKAVEEWNDPK